MRKPILSVDLDGTIADSHSRWLEIGRERYGIKAGISDLIDYDFWKITGPETKEEFMQIWRDLWDDYGKVKPQPGAHAALKELHKSYSIYFNSACVGSFENVKRWLKENDIAYDHFNLAANDEQKLDFKTDLHFEDAPPLIMGFASRGRNLVVISQPWNVGMHHQLSKYKNVYIAKNWDDAKRIALERDMFDFDLE